MYTPVATCMYQKCHIPRQDVIESDRKKESGFFFLGGGGGGGGLMLAYRVVDNNALLVR